MHAYRGIVALRRNDRNLRGQFSGDNAAILGTQPHRTKYKLKQTTTVTDLKKYKAHFQSSIFFELASPAPPTRHTLYTL